MNPKSYMFIKEYVVQNLTLMILRKWLKIKLKFFLHLLEKSKIRKKQLNNWKILINMEIKTFAPHYLIPIEEMNHL